MKECNFCQFENPDDALRCERCGKRLDVIICPDCNKENAIGSTICELCGRDLCNLDNEKQEILEKGFDALPDENGQKENGNDESINSDPTDNNSRTQGFKKGDWGPAIAGFSIGGPVALIMIASHSDFWNIVEYSGTSFYLAAMIFIGIR